MRVDDIARECVVIVSLELTQQNIPNALKIRGSYNTEKRWRNVETW